MANVDTHEEFWGVTLGKDKKEYIWDPSADSEEDIEHKLQLTQACLGYKAKSGERNLVEVVTEGADGNEITCPIISLSLGVKECIHLELGFSEVAKFVLKEGNGPIGLSGVHLQALPLDLEDNESGESDDEDIPNLVPAEKPEVKKVEKKADAKIDLKAEEKSASEVKESAKDEEKKVEKPVEDKKGKGKRKIEEEKKGTNPAKVPKTEPVNVEEDEESDEEDEDMEDDSEEDETSELIDGEAVEDSEDEDSEEDGDSEPEHGDDVDSEDDDDLDSDEDIEMDSDEEDEEDDDEEDEEEEIVVKKSAQKKKPAINGQAKATPSKIIPNGNKKDKKGTPVAGGNKKTPIAPVNGKTPKNDKESKTPTGKKDNKESKTPAGKKGTPGQFVKKTPEELKAFLLKSPNLPKKFDKFANYMKNNMKVTNGKEQKELWKYVQENKK